MRAKKSDAKLKRTAAVFAALGDELRLSLLSRLSADTDVSITRLTEGSRVTRQAVTKHLHVLAKAGVARSARHGREQLWRLEPTGLGEARRNLDAIAERWEGALGRLKELVEEA